MVAHILSRPKPAFKFRAFFLVCMRGVCPDFLTPATDSVRRPPDMDGDGVCVSVRRQCQVTMYASPCVFDRMCRV